jgi:hypothetical protein
MGDDDRCATLCRLNSRVLLDLVGPLPVRERPVRQTQSRRRVPMWPRRGGECADLARGHGRLRFAASVHPTTASRAHPQSSRNPRSTSRATASAVLTCGSCAIKFSAFALRQAAIISPLVTFSFPNRIFSSMEQLKRIGSWLTTPIRFRRYSMLNEHTS